MNDIESRRMRLLMDAFAIRLEASRARLEGLHPIADFGIEEAETLEVMAKEIDLLSPTNGLDEDQGI